MRMRHFLLALCTALVSMPLGAQILPKPGIENPRIQTVQWSAGQEVIVTALPNTGLTIMLEPGEQIRRVSVDNQDQLDVRVSAERDALLVLPIVENANAGMAVQTDLRDYQFRVQTAFSLNAAYLVSFVYDQPNPVTVKAEPPRPSWAYRLKGDRIVRPFQIADDGVRTRITFGPEQALPAVFAIGPTGDEEVVNGYMRNGVYVIDRIYSELVFRIDKEKATAKRNQEPTNASTP